MKIFTNLALTAALTLGATAAYAGNTVEPSNIVPASGSTIEVGTTIQVQFDSQMEWAVNYGWYDIKFTYATSWGTSEYSSAYDNGISIDGSILNILFDPDEWSQVAGGDYTLTIPAGLLAETSTGENNAEIVAVYTLAGGNDDPGTGDSGTLAVALQNNKEQGVVEYISIPINLDSAIDPSSYSYNSANAILFYKDGVEYSVTVGDMFGRWYQVTPSCANGDITEAGEYQLYFPEGAFSNGTTVTAEATFSWTISSGDDPGTGDDPNTGDDPSTGGSASLEPSTVYPYPGEYDVALDGAFEKITMQFQGTQEVITVNSNKEIAFINVSTGDSYACQAEYSEMYSNYAGWAYIIVTFDAIDVDGDYQLIFPQGTFTDESGNYNPELIYFYNVTGNTSADLKEMEFVSVTPSNDEPLYSLLEGESVVLGVTNANQAAYGRLTITGGPEGYVTQFGNDAYMTFTENEAIFENAQKDFFFYEGYEYTFTFELFDKYAAPRTTLFEHSVVYQGATPNTVFFSEITVSDASFNPVPGSELTPEANTVVLTFDAPATMVDGYATNGGQMAETTDLVASSNEDGTIWNLTVPASYVEGIWGDITLIMTFTDADGAYIIPGEATLDLYTYYNSEAGAMTSIAARYDCYQKGDVAEVTPAAGQVSELHEFSFTYTDGITWGGTVAVSNVKLYNEAGEVVAYGASYTEVDDYNVTVTLNTTITEPGKYTLDVPRFALSLGFEYIATDYKGQTVEYTIASSGINDALFDGQPVDVYTIQGIRVLSGANAAQINALPRGLYIAGGKKIVIR